MATLQNQQQATRARRGGRKLRVGLLGGAFDPVHAGHLEAAREVVRLGEADEVWLMPCFEHPTGRRLAPAADRLELCRLATHGEPSLGVFDYEFRHRLSGDLAHLIKRLLSEDLARNEIDFSMVIGQDNADAFHTRPNPDALVQLVRFLVMPRPGNSPPSSSAWYFRPPHVFLAQAQASPVSSTEVRRLLTEGDPDVARLLHPEVLAHIRAHHLYPCSPREPLRIPARKIALFTGSFDPPSRFHLDVAEELRQRGFAEVIIRPSGSRPGIVEQEHARPIHRAHLIDLTFGKEPGVRVDLTDLDSGVFTPPGDLEQQLRAEGEVWHVVASDFVASGCMGRSCIQTQWADGAALWRNSRFIVLQSPGVATSTDDLPPHRLLLSVGEHVPTAELRTRVYRGEPIDALVTPAVSAYIRRHGLFTATPYRGPRLRLTEPRVMIFADERNPRSLELAQAYRSLESSDPNLILVLGGDGTMLHAVREHWRLRLPFYGINTGHMGFLLNEQAPLGLHDLDLIVHHMPMLRVDTETPDGQRRRGLAFNDAWVEREGGQAAWLQLDVDGVTRVPKIVGDGLLIATPAGSSAYARAMGATPVPLGSPVLTLAGSNIFRPDFWKPVVLPDTATIKVTSLDRSGKRPIRCFLGGWPAGVVQSMEARLSNVAAVELAFDPEFDPSAKLLRSLFPAGE